MPRVIRYGLPHWRQIALCCVPEGHAIAWDRQDSGKIRRGSIKSPTESISARRSQGRALFKMPKRRPILALFADHEIDMDRSQTKLVSSTDCLCVACRDAIAEFPDPQTTRRHVRMPGPALCSTCHARILEAEASRMALGLHAILAEMITSAHGTGSPEAAVLRSIETWLDLPPQGTAEPDNVIAGQFGALVGEQASRDREACAEAFPSI